MTWWLWLLIVVLIVGVVAAALTSVVVRRQRERTAQLRERFGAEYDRAVKVAGGRRAGEAELEERLARRQGLELTATGEADRPAYEKEWADINAQFDEAELAALARADALVTTLLAERGYPMESFEQRAADLSVDYPEEVGHYRRAHATYRRADDGEGTREDYYEALQHYRAFLDALLGTDSSRPPGASAEGPPQRPPRPFEQPAETQQKSSMRR
jgi:hypothetical protein